MYSEEEFNQAIEEIRSWSTTLCGKVELLKSAGETCKANMEGDTVANNAADHLKASLERVEELLNTSINRLIANLEEERERARRIAQDSDDY